MHTLRKPLDMDLVADLYHRQGLSTRQIGARLGVGNKTVQRQMVWAGIGRTAPALTGSVKPPSGRRTKPPGIAGVNRGRESLQVPGTA